MYSSAHSTMKRENNISIFSFCLCYWKLRQISKGGNLLVIHDWIRIVPYLEEKLSSCNLGRTFKKHYDKTARRLLISFAQSPANGKETDGSLVGLGASLWGPTLGPQEWDFVLYNFYILKFVWHFSEFQWTARYSDSSRCYVSSWVWY